jgi:FtsZ-interacting cell division protein YlmF
MSEYQYYEFQAIDRPLTASEMNEVRSYSTRARITATSFVNEYSWGNFKGDEDVWMEKYFDAFLYLANWGTHIVKLRLPARLLDLETVDPYCGESTSVREKSGNIILTFASEDEEAGGWVDEDEAEGELSSLISVRSELARGDLRALYLGWLLCAQNGELEDDEIEPPVPAGLAQLSASLRGFAEFLRIDTALIDAAAAASPPLIESEPRPEEIRAWLAKLPVADKDDLLARLMVGNDAALGNELVQRMRRERTNRDDQGCAVAERRTVAALRRASEQAAEERMQIAAEKAAREKAERERAAARARAVHLDQLAGKEPVLWKKVESLIATKQPKSYDQAVEVLGDLRDLAARKDELGFRRHVEALRVAHGGKRTLISRLDKVGL